MIYGIDREDANFILDSFPVLRRGEQRDFGEYRTKLLVLIRSSVSLDWKRDVRRSFELIRRQVAPDRAALANREVDLRTLIPPDA